MRQILLILLLPVLVTSFEPSTTGLVEKNCPRRCRCDRHGRKIVYCQDRELIDIPYGIPRDTLELQLQDNVIVNGPRLNHELYQLASLTKLDLHSNKLTSFPERLPENLENLLIWDNDIKFVGKKPLTGLTVLQELRLDGNALTNQGLSQTTFADTKSLILLDLSNNKLTSVPEGLPQSLQFLYLKNNNIDTIKR